MIRPIRKIAIASVSVALAAVGIVAAPSVSWAAASFSTADNGWICTHGYYTFSDKHLTGGCSSVAYWYASGDYDRDSNTVKGSTLTKGAAKWNEADSSISFTKDKSSAIVNFYRTNLQSGTLAVTCLYNKSGSQITTDEKTELPSNYKTARVYTCESNMAQLSSNAARIATISHELGHVLGLSHRNTTPSSIMCTTGAKRTATAPAAKDVKTVKHIY